MQSTEQKIKNMASAAKEHVEIVKAKLDEKAEKAAARTPEEKEIAHERRKVKEAEAKMELHQAKARHAAEKLAGKQAHVYGHLQEHTAPAAAYYDPAQPTAATDRGQQPVLGSHGQQPVGTVDPVTGTAVPNYPAGHQYK